MPPRFAWVLLGLLLGHGWVAAQISSPPPVSQRAASGTPLSETFTPDTLFPKKSDPPAAPRPAPVVSDTPATNTPDGGLLPPAPPPPPPPKTWSGSADLGLNGATGNSDIFNIRGGWNVRRKTESNALTSDLQYVYSQQNGTAQSHQVLYNARDEILFSGSRWSAFTASQIEYDEFRAYRFRVGVYAGTALRLVDEKDFTFKLRAGAGATRELGTEGSPSRWLAEFLLGYDFRYKMTDRSTLVSILDFYPRVEDIRQFRMRGRFAYEYLLDPSIGAIFRVGIQERYDSDPGNAKRNDLTYFTTLGFKF
ncbi:DUF481 domain-containing protein [Limnoglobus roseus]|uniref:DUF481 domain-containing protein n=1 Tax=Limnoglobus roseus TaxID=2598579 RepID=A0A5C1AUA5_9BACT|nr:DUF481 domain-containing protein [Limnoglobus roseus]QEL20358.1 hypothetical protein PX52LOC_07451 [Limnoglobus roseus]